ncbi:MAG: DMT family transporter [Polyangiales bacterium]
MRLQLREGIRHMVVATLFFSAMSVCAKFAGARLPTMELVLARVVVTFVMSVVAIRQLKISPWGNRRGLLIVRGLCGFMGLSCFFYSIGHLPLADATVIQFCNPMLTAVIASFALRERLRPLDILGTMLSVAGVVLVAQPSFLFDESVALDPLAVTIGFCGAVFSALSYVVIRKLGETENPYVVVFYFPLVTGPASLPLLAAQGVVMPEGVEWLFLLGIGVAAQLGQIEMTQGFRTETAGRASAVTYLQIVLAFIWGMVFFGEYPDIYSIVGAILVVFSVFSVAARR